MPRLMDTSERKYLILKNINFVFVKSRVVYLNSSFTHNKYALGFSRLYIKYLFIIISNKYYKYSKRNLMI